MKQNFLDKVIAIFSPGSAVERQKQRVKLDMLNDVNSEVKQHQRRYDAASKSRHTSDWFAPNQSVNQEVHQALTWLRDRSRDLGRNNPYARRAFRLYPNNTIGTGIMPTPKNIRPNQIKALKDAWYNWAEKLVCGLTSWCNQLSMLGAEIGIAGFSSVGVNKGGGYGVPAVTSSYNLLYNNVSRSFSPVPDAIVINLGTNDTSSIAAGMTTLLNGLLAACANNTSIFVMLPFNGASTAGGASALQAAIAACNAPGKVYYMDTTGFVPANGTTDGLHPASWASTSQITQKVQQVIRPYLNNKRRGFAKMY